MGFFTNATDAAKDKMGIGGYKSLYDLHVKESRAMGEKPQPMETFIAERKAEDDQKKVAEKEQQEQLKLKTEEDMKTGYKNVRGNGLNGGDR
jgi:hypothetical protein